jgi:hypothetical protein
MAKDSGGRQSQLRQLVAQHAARMMAEDGISDYGYAKKKAGRQLGVVDANCLPSNAEIEEEIRLFHDIYNSEDQPAALRILRQDALATMQIFARFNPHLTGSVLDGTAGQYAETQIHLFADSAKDVEIFLLNQQIPYDSNDKSHRVRDRKSSEKKASGKSSERLKVPMFTLEGPNGFIKLSVFEFDDIRFSTKSVVSGGNADRVDAEGLRILLNED